MKNFGITILVGCVLVVVGLIWFLTKPKSVNNIQLQSSPANNQSQRCPDGFIKVPGDPLYNTQDFCVMKYDAKCANVDDLKNGLQPPVGSSCSSGSFGTYKNNGSGCACVGNKKVVSVKSGFPIAYLPEADNTSNNAENYCKTQGWHLITNNEWMTIARNVEKVSANWCDKDGTNCGFSPGTTGKILANGHNDSNNEPSIGTSKSSALIAGDDNQPCFGTTTDGSNQCGGKGSQKRTLTLDNNEIIWDLAGNVWSWVDNTIARKDQPKSKTNGVLDTHWIWSEFTPNVTKSVITDNGTSPSLGYDAFRPSNPAWNSTNGVGRIYHFSSATDTDTALYTFIRGGNWRHGYDSGAFTIHLSPEATRPNINDVGFRCVGALQ